LDWRIRVLAKVGKARLLGRLLEHVPAGLLEFWLVKLKNIGERKLPNRWAPYRPNI
jgi:hypothetical protein